jgi:hypothetical protein
LIGAYKGIKRAAHIHGTQYLETHARIGKKGRRDKKQQDTHYQHNNTGNDKDKLVGFVFLRGHDLGDSFLFWKTANLYFFSGKAYSITL